MYSDHAWSRSCQGTRWLPTLHNILVVVSSKIRVCKQMDNTDGPPDLGYTETGRSKSPEGHYGPGKAVRIVNRHHFTLGEYLFSAHELLILSRATVPWHCIWGSAENTF